MKKGQKRSSVSKKGEGNEPLIDIRKNHHYKEWGDWVSWQKRSKEEKKKKRVHRGKGARNEKWMREKTGGRNKEESKEIFEKCRGALRARGTSRWRGRTRGVKETRGIVETPRGPPVR